MKKCTICGRKFKFGKGVGPHMAAHERRGETEKPEAAEAVGVRSAEKPEKPVEPASVILNCASGSNGTMTAATHLNTAIRMVQEELGATEKKVVELELAKNDVTTLKARLDALIEAQKSMEG